VYGLHVFCAHTDTTPRTDPARMHHAAYVF
jgi:hypothetical protein